MISPERHLNLHIAFTIADSSSFCFALIPFQFTILPVVQTYMLFFCPVNRFAQFFLCPLFTASATEREVNAINSENDGNLQNDSWRSFQLEKCQAKDGHDYSKFSTGTGNSLVILYSFYEKLLCRLFKVSLIKAVLNWKRT